MSSIRPWLPAALVATMLLTGCGTYLFLGSHQSAVRQHAKTPVQLPAAPPALLLPGTLYLVQGGAIYTLSAGRFSQRCAAQPRAMSAMLKPSPTM